jgi:hypothetical protein
VRPDYDQAQLETGAAKLNAASSIYAAWLMGESEWLGTPAACWTFGFLLERAFFHLTAAGIEVG